MNASRRAPRLHAPLRRAIAASVLIAGSFAAPEHAGIALDDRKPPQPASGGRLPLEDSPSEPRPQDDEAHRALLRGLDYLAVAQKEHQDGSFPLAGGAQHAPVALAALGALAFMAEGSTPDRGRYGERVTAAVDYLLSKADTSASDSRGYLALSLEDKWGMHGHGYAVLALCNAYTLAPRTERGRRIAELLPDAVRVIEHSQSAEGGWFYFPVAELKHENSVTVVQLQALRAARNCGIAVDAGVIGKAVDYIRRCQSENGAFRYALDPTSKTSLALTAAGLATLQNAGRYSGPEVDRAVHEIWSAIVERQRRRDADPRAHESIDFPHYERLYVALALWTHSDRRLFESWFEPEREHVLRGQRPDGSWPDDQFGAAYATAMTCLFLSIDDGLLPLFER